MANVPSLKAKRAISNFIGNRGTSMAKAMVQAGYSPVTARNPKNLTDTKLFKDTMQELGLTDDLLVRALVSDIKSKPKRRFKELELGFKVTGRLSPEGMGGQQTNIQINITGHASNRFVDANATNNQDENK